jgi:hypothetical protein
LVADAVGTHDNTRNFVPSKTFTCFEMGLPFDERWIGVLLASDHDDVCKTVKPLRPPKSVGLTGIPNFDANGWPGIFASLLKFISYPGFS